MPEASDVERQRLRASPVQARRWRQWGPYLSERQWGTVREDYSANGDAWAYFTHEHARSRVYRWGEDGIAGFCDDMQLLCFSLALWNGRDPILKERLFGLTNDEGNHGEDVKEAYYYLDAVPSHAYGKMLYKLPQGPYPYEELVAENRRRKGHNMPEYEILDTGLFDEDRYFDVMVEYAKDEPDDILMRITVSNRGPDAAPIHVLPQAVFRNTWSWDEMHERPRFEEWNDGLVSVRHKDLGPRSIAFENADDILFCNNETNYPLVFDFEGGDPFPKDGFHRYVVDGETGAVNPALTGTKVAGLFARTVEAGETIVLRVRSRPDGAMGDPFADFDSIVEARIKEADAFYADIQRGVPNEDMALIQRQAFAGMLWSKQFYCFDVARWLDGDPTQPPPPKERRHGRNHDWRHLNAADIITMPDKWEYPWFAAWDLGFHCVTYSLIDAEFAKDQLLLLCRVWMMHPNGELPAYEWEFGDVNPPVHAWAALRVYENDKRLNGTGDLAFLERIFQKLLLNFTWWVNRKDQEGHNLFEGGFLGLDNIGVFDRSKPLPTGGYVSQSDGTAWMAMFCLNMQRIAVELAQHNENYEDMVVKFFEHFLYIARAMTDMGRKNIGLWNAEDQFYYDVLCMPDGEKVPIRLRSMVGLIPLFAVEMLETDEIKRMPNFIAKLHHYWARRTDLASLVSLWRDEHRDGRRLLSLARGPRIAHILRRMLDEAEFLSPHGIRAMSAHYRDKPYDFDTHGIHYGTVGYVPAESNSGLFGGNSNWRGPVWMPVNFMLVISLRRFHDYFGDDLTVECPTGSDKSMNLSEVADDLCDRLISLFTRDANGDRPIFSDCRKLQDDPHFRDYILFSEYFDGDNGRGLGASHQTGWSGLVANLIYHMAQVRLASEAAANAVAEEEPLTASAEMYLSAVPA